MSQGFNEQVGRASVGSVITNLGTRVSAIEANPVIAMYEIKICADDDAVATGDGLFQWSIPQDLNGKRVLSAEAYVTTAGSSATVVQVRKVGGSDMLSVPITIDSGDLHSEDSSTRSTVSAGDDVFVKDILSIDVDSAGTGAMGLGVMVGIG